MAETLYKFGKLEFSAANFAPEKFTKESSYRWASIERLKRDPARQWMGPGEQLFTFSGVSFPGLKLGADVVGHRKMREIESIAAQGEPDTLVDGTGQVWGKLVILDLTEDREIPHTNTIPRKITFTIKFASYGDDEDAPLNGAEPAPSVPSFGFSSGNVA